MTSRLFKYSLTKSGFFGYVNIDLSERAEVLHVGIQHNEMIHIWVATDPDAPLFERVFLILPTGAHIPESFTFIGTVLSYNGAIVSHIFEEVNEV